MEKIILAVILGGAFGFVLQKVGAADPQKIIGMLTLTDLHLVKAILAGIGLSSGVLFLALTIGVISEPNFSIKTMHFGVITGGALLGAGWAISGFCPGTGVVAMGAGRRDAWFFVLGGLVGAGIFTLFYGSFAGSGLFTHLLGGKSALAAVESGHWVAILIACAFIVLASILPHRFR